MHEVALVEELLGQVAEELRRAGVAGRVTRVELAVGRLSGAHPDALRFAFELLSPDSAAAGAELVIAEPPAVCVCAACGGRTEVDELAPACPACGSPRIVFAGGRELLLQSIELAEG